MSRNVKVVLAAVVLILIYFVMTAFTPARLEAQELASSNNMTRYELEKKDPTQAAIIEAIVPILGHAYVGDAEKGFVPAAVSAGGLLLMVLGGDGFNAGLMSLGYLTYLGGRVWGVVSAYQMAEAYDMELRQRYGLAMGPVIRQDGTFGFQLSFSTQ